MTKFKICGLRQAEHAIAAANAGADFLGFVFVEGVRRQLLEQQGESIVKEYRGVRGDGGPKLVGLFANQSIEFVNRVVKNCDLDFVQLCGDEPREYWDSVDVPVIKQVRVRDDGSKSKVIDDVLKRVEQVVSGGHMVLLDKHETGLLGGTGRAFDWSVAKAIAKRHDFLLAGGLSPENLNEAISTVGPWGVDVSSGVETDGVKDCRKIVKFAEEVLSTRRG